MYLSLWTQAALRKVIAGWTTALQLMKEGEKWEIVVPGHLAYGDEWKGPHIYPGAVLCFELVLLQVLG